jgi:hypothetical protein
MERAATGPEGGRRIGLREGDGLGGGGRADAAVGPAEGVRRGVQTHRRAAGGWAGDPRERMERRTGFFFLLFVLFSSRDVFLPK